MEGEELGDGRAEGSSAIGERGQATVLLTLDAEGRLVPRWLEPGKHSYLWILTAWRFICRGLCYCSATKSCATLCDPMDYSTPCSPVHHYLPEFAQTHVYWGSDAIQPSHPLSPPSTPAFNLSQHQGLFQWVSSSHQVAKVLELQLQHQSFWSLFRVDSI